MRGKTNIVDNGAFGIAFGWIVWIPLAAIGSVFLGSVLIVVVAGGISLFDHSPLIRGPRQASANLTEPDDPLATLFGRAER